MFELRWNSFFHSSYIVYAPHLEWHEFWPSHRLRKLLKNEPDADSWWMVWKIWLAADRPSICMYVRHAHNSHHPRLSVCFGRRGMGQKGRVVGKRLCLPRVKSCCGSFKNFISIFSASVVSASSTSCASASAYFHSYFSCIFAATA